MRHLNAHSKLNKSGSHRQALLMNLTQALITYERITTTVRRAKEVRSYAEKLITKAKKGDLASRRLVAKSLHDKVVVKKLFDTVGKEMAGRNGGYTRIIHTANRVGDAAPMAILELVTAKAITLKTPELDKKAKKEAAPKAKKAAKAHDHAHDHDHAHSHDDHKLAAPKVAPKVRKQVVKSKPSAS